MLENKESLEFIKKTRERLSLTRRNLALILDVSEPTIIRWEGAQKGKDATSIDKHNLQLIKTLKWLYEEVQKEKTGVHLKYIFSIILGTSESKKALGDMQKKGFGWVAIGLTASFSFTAIPFSLMSLIPAISGLSIAKLALDKKKNEELFKNLTTYSQLYGAKGLLYLASQIKLGIKIK